MLLILVSAAIKISRAKPFDWARCQLARSHVNKSKRMSTYIYIGPIMSGGVGAGGVLVLVLVLVEGWRGVDVN